MSKRGESRLADLCIERRGNPLISAKPTIEELALLRNSPVEVHFGAPADQIVVQLARACSRPERVLLVSHRPILQTDSGQRVLTTLEAHFAVTTFDGAAPDPTTETVAAALAKARADEPKLIVGLGGGSAMDCAKAVNLLYRCGGAMADYRGDPPMDVLKKRPPLLPMILIPTTAGTGSEAQSFALISDTATHMKAACGDRRLPTDGGLRPRAAILDAELTRTQPRGVAAATGMDAITHAVETAGCRIRNDVSRAFSLAAWRRLSMCFERVLRDNSDDDARAGMLLGAHLAGCAIENAMLGGAHACANPITAKIDVAHGVAVGVMLPHVIRWNARNGENPYADLDPSAEHLAGRIEQFMEMADFPRRLGEIGVTQGMIDELADGAARQWTAGFNPVPLSRADFQVVYRAAL